MGKIVVKAQQQNVFNKDKSGSTESAYVLRPVRYTTMKSDDIVNYCAANSIVPKAYLSASMVALSQCIENFLLNGHSVEFPNLGIFSLSSRGISEQDVTKTGIAQLNKLNVRFLPCTKLKTEVDNVTLEFDGAYDIAGETEDGGKYYKKVVRKDTGAGGSTLVNYTVTVTSANTAQGTVTGGGTYTNASRITVKATPNAGYVFDKWSDGDTNASRNIIVSQNLTLTASFKASGSTSDDDEMEHN